MVVAVTLGIFLASTASYAQLPPIPPEKAAQLLKERAAARAKAAATQPSVAVRSVESERIHELEIENAELKAKIKELQDSLNERDRAIAASGVKRDPPRRGVPALERTDIKRGASKQEVAEYMKKHRYEKVSVTVANGLDVETWEHESDGVISSLSVTYRFGTAYEIVGSAFHLP
jgi:seryl-tRNA synthetase